jgi:hypothetical protein
MNYSPVAAIDPLENWYFQMCLSVHCGFTMHRIRIKSMVALGVVAF